MSTSQTAIAKARTAYIEALISAPEAITVFARDWLTSAGRSALDDCTDEELATFALDLRLEALRVLKERNRQVRPVGVTPPKTPAEHRLDAVLQAAKDREHAESEYQHRESLRLALDAAERAAAAVWAQRREAREQMPPLCWGTLIEDPFDGVA